MADRLRLNRRLVAWAQRLKDSLREAEVTLPLCVGDGEAITKRLAVLRRQQLLCALREGPFGSLQAAAFVAGQLRRWDALAHWSGREWYPGRCVIVTRNDPAARLFNGDVGICVRVSQGERPPLLQVLFESAPDGPSFGQAGRLFDPNTLPVHEDAFALTIHKSQGSEYDHVAVLLPPGAESPLLVRQTLYTGLSRAKTSVDMWSTEASREKAIGSAMQRHGRLAMRIASD